MIKRWMRVWFPIWEEQRRLRVAGEYAALTNSQHLMADLAMRNFAFAPLPAGEISEAGIAEGRRRCVLEILDMARVDPREIAALEIRPRQQKRENDDVD